jgi:hypothetical protein
VLIVCHGDAKPCSAAELDADAFGGVEIHKVVSGPRVQEGGDPSTVYVDVELHGAPRAWANDGGRVDGDHGRVGDVPRCVVVFHYLDIEQVFAHLWPCVKNSSQ